MRFLKEDRALLKSLRRGKADALKVIYEKYKKDMLAVALALASDRSVAEDVVHDVFVSFAGASRRLTIKRSLKSYLLTSVVNRLRSIMKSRKKAASSFAYLEPADPPSVSLADFMLIPSDGDRLNRALAALPEPQRIVIVLHVLEGLKFRVIAETQGESLNTVQSRYRYGMQKMKTLFLGGNSHG